LANHESVTLGGAPENPALDFLYRACALFSGYPGRGSQEFDEAAPRSEAPPMNCPYCQLPIPELWQPLLAVTDGRGLVLATPIRAVRVVRGDDEQTVELQYMQCPADPCLRIIVRARATEARIDMRRPPFIGMGQPDLRYASTGWADGEWWFAVPERPSTRLVDPLVPDIYARDFREACLILEDSPRMSAVLSRRILSDLMLDYGNYPKDGKQLEAFINDEKNPQHLRGDIAYLKEIGHFGAHTQRDTTTGEVIDVEPKEAGWSLDVIAGLFDYWIVGPALSKERRASIDGKVQRTGRPPLSRFWKRPNP